MKRVVVALVFTLVMALLLNACGCKHTWAEASCTEAKTCTRCNTTEGEALGHNWMEATCKTPKTCSACALAEGDALGHSYGEWSCTGEQFKYSCAVCGEEKYLTPEEFFLELLVGQWKAVRFPAKDQGESVTVHEDGTVDMNLASQLVCPDTVRMVAGELFHMEESHNWGMHFYLEDHLTEGWDKLDREHGLYLLITAREDKQEDGVVMMLQHRGYGYSWHLEEY